MRLFEGGYYLFQRYPNAATIRGAAFIRGNTIITVYMTSYLELLLQLYLVEVDYTPTHTIHENNPKNLIKKTKTVCT